MRYLLCFLLVATMGFAEAKLQFMPNVPVEQTIHIVIDMHQNLPGFKMDAFNTQDFVSILKVTSDGPITHGPVDVTFTLKDLNVDLKINEKALKFQSKDPSQSVETAQIAKAMNRPIRLQLNENFQLSDKNPELDKLVSDLPQLAKLDLEKIIREMFVYSFALAGKNLKPGSTFLVNLPDDLFPGLPVPLSYTITHIENETVFGTFTGTINAIDKPLENQLQISDDVSEEVFLNAKGKISGKGQWNIKNALIHAIDTDFDVTGSIKVNNLEWPLSLKGKVTVISQSVK